MFQKLPSELIAAQRIETIEPNRRKRPDCPETLWRLMRRSDRAVLSTAMPDGGWPYGSLVMAACDQAARPLLLISDLAEHTTNLGHDNRASLLFDGTAASTAR